MHFTLIFHSVFFCNHIFFNISPSSSPSGGNVLKLALVFCQNWFEDYKNKQYLLITIHKGASIKWWVISVDRFLVLKEVGMVRSLGIKPHNWIGHLSAVSLLCCELLHTCMIKCSPDPFTSAYNRNLQVKLCTDFALVVPHVSLFQKL